MTEFCEYTTPLTADEMTALAEIIASVKARVEKEVKELYPQNMTDPADVPKWFNDMFLEIMDRLLYDCECDDLPEILVNVRDYISGLSRPVGKE